MIDTITIENKGRFFFKLLSADEVGEARQLCDECVGKNLYFEDEIAATIGSDDRFFYLVKNENQETVGYIYYLFTEAEEIAKYTKLDISLIRTVCSDPNKKVGKFQSIGIKPEYRGIGISTQMILFVLKKMKEASAEIAFSICWKPGGTLPVAKVIAACEFSYLTEAKLVWYDDPDLICPYCKGRCVCDAAVYYKILDGENKNEA